MDKNIIIISDNAHGKNNVYYKISKDDQEYKIHSNILNDIYQAFPQEKDFYIFGEAIDTISDIVNGEKSFHIEGEGSDKNMYFYKLLNGFSGILFSPDQEFISIIINRIESMINSIIRTGYDHVYTEVYEHYKNLLTKIYTPEKFIIYENILDKLISINNNNNFWSEETKDFLIKIMTTAKQVLTMRNSDILYNITLAIRDTIIVDKISKIDNKNICIIIGGNHVNNIITYLKKYKVILNEDEIKIIIKNSEELIVSNTLTNTLTGGNQKYKFTNLQTILKF